MRSRLKIILSAALALLITQCDPDEAGLFPSYLTRVSHTRNLSDVLPGVPGATYMMHVMWSGSQKIDFVYVVQVLPDGSRRLAVLNGALTLISTDNDSQAGRLHIPVDENYHIVGTSLVNVTIALAGEITEMVEYGGLDWRNLYIVSDGAASFYAYGPVSYDGNITTLTCYQAVIDPGEPAIDDSNTCTAGIGMTGRDFALEGAGSAGSGSPGAWLVLRDRATNEGYFYAGGANPASISEYDLHPMGRIVPGTVTFDFDGRPIVEKLDSRIYKFESDGSEADNTDSIDLHGYIVAYGENDSMYLFNPGTRQLMKTLAWWRDY
ncbi:MAG: hypothetical protein JXD23_01140 [Spirochaetales bacterium]|nr:hypothetical protein [Spirochaetales bacterium]